MPSKRVLDIDSFMNHYITPFAVNGVFLDEVDSIFLLYLDMMLASNTLAEMRNVARQFKFLAWGVEDDLDKLLSDKAVPRIHRLFNSETNCLQIANLRLPPIMLHAHLLAADYELPEYYAALQYVRAVTPLKTQGKDHER